MKKPKLGRPFLPPEERKQAPLQIRLTASERADCEEAAKLDSLKLSAWVRNTLTSAAKRRIDKRRITKA